MKIKEGFVLQQFADKYFAVAVGDNADKINVLVTLNKSGAFVWELLQNDTNYENVINALTEHYDINEKTAKKDFENFLELTRNAGLIDE